MAKGRSIKEPPTGAEGPSTPSVNTSQLPRDGQEQMFVARGEFYTPMKREARTSEGRHSK